MESPNEMFGKLMSVSDDLMWSYYELLTELAVSEIDVMKTRVSDGDLHPKQAKVDLAQRIITDFHSAEEATDAAAEFERRFARKELPTELTDWSATVRDDGSKLASIIVGAGLARSSSAATRLIDQGGVRIDGERITDRMHRLFPPARSFVLQVGRKAVRVNLVQD